MIAYLHSQLRFLELPTSPLETLKLDFFSAKRFQKVTGMKGLIHRNGEDNTSHSTSIYPTKLKTGWEHIFSEIYTNTILTFEKGKPEIMLLKTAQGAGHIARAT